MYRKHSVVLNQSINEEALFDYFNERYRRTQIKIYKAPGGSRRR